VCDLETSRIGAPYIYGISSLRVNLKSTDFVDLRSIIISQCKVKKKQKLVLCISNGCS